MKLPAARPDLVTGEVVQAVLSAEGLAQADLGRRLGWDQRQIGRWISGESRIPLIVRHILSCPHCYRHFVQNAACGGTMSAR